jgi:hypothetical protein
MDGECDASPSLPIIVFPSGICQPAQNTYVLTANSCENRRATRLEAKHCRSSLHGLTIHRYNDGCFF